MATSQKWECAQVSAKAEANSGSRDSGRSSEMDKKRGVDGDIQKITGISF
jgi:hypothetical protein